ncbi:MAG TPA: hypothetical protein VJB92_03985 [Candidatus Paceibacterota bacterium]
MPEINIDRSFIKISAISVLCVIFAGLFGYNFASLIASLNPGNLSDLAYILIIWGVFLALQVFFVKSFSIGSAVAFIQTLAIWIFLPEKFGGLNLLAVFSLFVFLALSFAKGRRELNDYLKIRFFKISRRAGAVALTGVALFIAIYSIALMSASGANTISKDAFNFLMKGSDVLIAKIVPGFSSEDSVGNALKSFARVRLPEGAAESDIGREAESLRRQLSTSLKFQLNAEEKVIDALYNILVLKLLAVSEYSRSASLAVTAVIVFLLAKSIAFFLNWIIIFITFGVYQLLMALNFMHISFESQNKEIIILD